MDENKQTAHSEEYFGDYRDHWWNPDFVELMAARLDWGAARNVLDVGSGAGHWARIIAPHLSPEARLSAIDSDPKWADSNMGWARSLAAEGLQVAVAYGSAENIPFPDHEFDFVTCQTVLIHVADPAACIAEMLRVLQPGGLLLCVEPDNFGTCAAATSLSGGSSLEYDVAAFEFNLAQQRGRKAVGLGDLSLGGLLPGMFAAAGLQQVRVHLSDKAMPLIPPYDTAEQRAVLGDSQTWFESAPDFSKAQAQQFFIAGGGSPSAFEKHWSAEVAGRDDYLRAVGEQSYHCAGGALMYLVSGRKC